MRLLTRRTIEKFAVEHSAARQALADWCAMVESAGWCDADAVRRSVGGSVRPVGDRRLVFNILGNQYRIVCSVRYVDLDQDMNGIIKVHFIGTHAEYNLIDALTVTY